MMDMATARTTLAANLAKLPTYRQDFARSILGTRFPSPKQAKWIVDLAEMVTAAPVATPKPAAMTVAGAGLERLKTLFERALKYGPRAKIRMDGFTLSPAKASGTNPGAIYVKGTGGEYLGKITAAHEWRPVAAAAAYPTLATALVALASDPAGVAAAIGQRSGECCFCGRELHGNGGRSLAVGYGPDCAERYGLPWGTETVPAEVKVA